MKKLFIVGLAVICVAFAAPAMAKVTFGGWLTTDLYYLDQSDDFTSNTVQGATNYDNGRSEININLPQAQNRFDMHYKSDDGMLTGRIQMREGGTDENKGADIWEYAYLDWKLNDMVHFRIGRQSQTFAIMAPGAAGMGHADRFTLLVGYGNVHGGTARDAVKAYVKFNDMIRMEIMAIDPSFDGGEAPANFNTNANTGAFVREENTIPRFDISFPITVANFTIEPAGTYLTQNYDQVDPGKEDSVDIWGLSLGVKAGFGPVTVSGEITYGQNLGDDSYVGAVGVVGRAVDRNGDGINESIEDTDVVAGWLQVDFNFGPATLKLAMGIEDYQNDGVAGANDDIERTKIGYAVALPIKVAKGFTIMPNVIYHDADDSGLDGANNPLTTDYGNEILVGVQFSLKF